MEYKSASKSPVTLPPIPKKKAQDNKIIDHDEFKNPSGMELNRDESDEETPY